MSEQTFKVLVADDDEAVRESLQKVLHSEGYQVAVVANGADAMEKFQLGQGKIDLLLVDLNMPLKNGWATLDRLLEINPSLPILIVTGQPNQYEMAEAAGVSALVEKPIDVPALLQLIHKLLARPVKACLQNTGHREVTFQFVRAFGCASHYSWPDQHVSPYIRWTE